MDVVQASSQILIREEVLPFHPLHRRLAKIDSIGIKMTVFGLMTYDQNRVAVGSRAKQKLGKPRTFRRLSIPFP